MKCVFGFYMKPVNVVQVAVPGFGNYRQGPPIAFHVSIAALYLPLDHGIPNYPDTVSVFHHHRSVEKSRIFDPVRSGHLAVPVQAEVASKNCISGFFSARQNCSNPSANRADTDLQGTIP